ncbi:hypothetical protein HS125_06015 [bacterium]|nr:hypothetical protein [bacterium]
MKNLAGIILALVGAALLWPLGGCESHRHRHTRVEVESGPMGYPGRAGPPPHAPAHGVRRKAMYVYRYHPDCFVYFDTSRSLYFYMEGGKWRSGASLPVGFSSDLGSYVTLEMSSQVPYSRFSEHKRKYPPRGGQEMRKGGGPVKSSPQRKSGPR